MRVGIALACLALGACSGGKEATNAEGRPGGVKPDTAAGDTYGPVSPPAGFAEVSGEGFTLAAPPGFRAERRTSSNGEPMLVLETTQVTGGLVAVVRDVRPRADAVEQSITLEKTTRTVEKATDVRREEIEWPGTSRAVLLQWTVVKSERGAPAEAVRTVQLFAEVDRDLILNVVATAPARSFDQAEVATVLRTFRPRLAES